MENHFVLTKLKNALSWLAPSEKKVANYIINNHKNVPSMTVKELANASESSEAAVVRLCKSLDIQSYKNLKMYIFNEINNQKQISSQKQIDEILKNDEMKTILNKVSYMNIKGIEDTLKLISANELEKAVSIINNARRVLVYGIGGSSVVASDFAFKLSRIGIVPIFYQDSHIQLTNALHSTEEDVFVLITASGKTVDILDIAKNGKERGAKIIVITQYSNSPILEYSDVNLYTANIENNLRIGTMASRIAQLTIIDALYVGLCVSERDKNLEKIYMTRDILHGVKRL